MRRRRRKTQPWATTPKVAALDTNQGKALQFPFPLCRGGRNRQGGALGQPGGLQRGAAGEKGTVSPEAQPCHTRGRTAPRPGPSRRGWLSQPDVERRHQNGNCPPRASPMSAPAGPRSALSVFQVKTRSCSPYPTLLPKLTAVS